MRANDIALTSTVKIELADVKRREAAIIATRIQSRFHLCHHPLSLGDLSDLISTVLLAVPDLDKEALC